MARRSPTPTASLLPAVTEREVLAACLSYLRMRGIPAWRMNVGAVEAQYQGKGRFVRFGVKGMSDIIGIIPFEGTRYGAMLAVECKGPKGRLRPEQAAFLETIRSAGGIALVVRGVHELAKAIDQLD